MRKGLLVIITIIVIMISVAAFAHADSHITISYQSLGVTETETTATITLELEVTNTGVSELRNLNIELTSPAGGGIQGRAEINTLPSNGTGRVTGVFTAPKVLLDIEPFFFEITYTDRNGQLQKAMIQGTKR